MKKHFFLAALLGAFSASAFAQQMDDLKDLNSALSTPGLVGSNVTGEAKKKAEDLGHLLAKEALKGVAESPKLPDYQEAAAKMARKADDIADASLSSSRKEILQFLGINPDGESSLYYFVTWEMPLEVLRSYAVEAMWSGGTLVFRGIPKDMDLQTYMTKNLSGLVYGKGAAAAISLDPRLFDAYDIKIAPTIVYTEERKNLECNGLVETKVQIGGQELSYSRCPPLDPSKYWKISGAITTDFALRQMIDAGAVGAKPYLAALAKGFGTGEAPPKLQQAYKGEWKSELTPSDVKAVQDMSNSLQKTQ